MALHICTAFRLRRGLSPKGHLGLELTISMDRACLHFQIFKPPRQFHAEVGSTREREQPARRRLSPSTEIHLKKPDFLTQIEPCVFLLQFPRNFFVNANLWISQQGKEDAMEGPFSARKWNASSGKQKTPRRCVLYNKPLSMSEGAASLGLNCSRTLLLTVSMTTFFQTSSLKATAPL